MAEQYGKTIGLNEEVLKSEQVVAGIARVLQRDAYDTLRPMLEQGQRFQLEIIGPKLSDAGYVDGPPGERIWTMAWKATRLEEPSADVAG